ncbi:MAG TPA: hypothetical protein VMV27_07835 [Candidatus Binataceae bacterium]|nr:hypothetical protein [Candidatus Binataceae bacterium]
MKLGIFIGGRGYHLNEVSGDAVTLSKEEHAIIRMTGCSRSAFIGARAKRLAGIDPVTGKAAPIPDERTALQPFPPEDAADDDEDDPVAFQLRTGPMRVKFPRTVTERHPDGRITRRKADR